MNIIIKRFLISIALLIVLVVTIKFIITKEVYLITYDKYIFEPESQKHTIDKQNEHIFINAYTKQGAINDATEYLYLNSLIISDSIDIKSIEIF